MKSNPTKPTASSTCQLTPRQLNQVKAAVKFWRLVAEHSNTHPARHHGVESLFETHGPLSLDELDDLLDSGLLDGDRPAAPLLSVAEIAEETNYSQTYISKLIDRHAIPAETRKGRGYLYRRDRLGPIFAAAERRKLRDA